MSIFIEWIKLIGIWLFTTIIFIIFIVKMVYDYQHQKPWYQSWFNCFLILFTTINVIFCINSSVTKCPKSIPHRIDVIEHEQQVQQEKEEQRKKQQEQHDEKQHKKIKELKQKLDDIEFKTPLSQYTTLDQLNNYKKQINQLDDCYFKGVLLDQINHIIKEFKDE